MEKAEIKRVLKLCRQIQDQLNNTKFALKGESGVADLTGLTARVEQLESKHTEVTGIEQLATGGGFGQWQRYEDENSLMSTIKDLTTKLAKANARIKELEAQHTEVTGIEQLATGGGFGSWQRYEEKSELQLAIEDLTARIEQLENNANS